MTKPYGYAGVTEDDHKNVSYNADGAGDLVLALWSWSIGLSSLAWAPWSQLLCCINPSIYLA